MMVRDFHELNNSGRAISDAQWTSVRMLLASDGMGFSFYTTTLKAGSENGFHYQHHFESVYCIPRRGRITDLGTRERHEIRPGVMYVLDQDDKDTLVAQEDPVMTCCFNPPAKGTEVHLEDGSYLPAD